MSSEEDRRVELINTIAHISDALRRTSDPKAKDELQPRLDALRSELAELEAR